ncbi:MAG: hypothetical protein ACREOQ_03435 [Gemmatimonadales bacterium]
MSLRDLGRRMYRRLSLLRELSALQHALPMQLAGVQRLLQEEQVHRLLQDPRYAASKRLNRHEHQVFSQNGEDGVLREIYRRIEARDRTFVEIGVGDGQTNNTTFLLTQGWRGQWIEGSERSVAAIRRSFRAPLGDGRLTLVHAQVTAENVGDLLRRAGAPAEPDLLSLDIDRNTWWVLSAALEVLRPRVLVVEYNATYPPDLDWVVEYDGARWWNRTSYFGASLKAYERLGRQHGLRLVGCDLTGVNAFFVRDELAGNHFEEPATAEALYEPARYYLARTHGHPPAFSDLTD